MKYSEPYKKFKPSNKQPNNKIHNYLVINPDKIDLSFKIPVSKRVEDKWTVENLKSEVEKKSLSYFKDC
jgi:hypothetical protein